MSPIPLGILAASGGVVETYEKIAEYNGGSSSTLLIENIPIENYSYLEVRVQGRKYTGSNTSIYWWMDGPTKPSTTEYNSSYYRSSETGTNVYNFPEAQESFWSDAPGTSAGPSFTGKLMITGNPNSTNRRAGNWFGGTFGVEYRLFHSAFSRNVTPTGPLTTLLFDGLEAESRFTLYGYRAE
jgi:hypothetical protein